MILPEYVADKDGWWYKWNYKYHKYVALKMEYWPTAKANANASQNSPVGSIL